MRVLDVTRVLAGPTCGRTLAEHGADVLRIGTPRYPDNELMMRDTGHGKRSAVLDLATPEGAETLRTLARDTHVFAQGYRPGTIASRGFAPEDLMALASRHHLRHAERLRARGPMEGPSRLRQRRPGRQRHRRRVRQRERTALGSC